MRKIRIPLVAFLLLFVHACGPDASPMPDRSQFDRHERR
jgi:hypothetical protein